MTAQPKMPLAVVFTLLTLLLVGYLLSGFVENGYLDYKVL